MIVNSVLKQHKNYENKNFTDCHAAWYKHIKRQKYTANIIDEKKTRAFVILNPVKNL